MLILTYKLLSFSIPDKKTGSRKMNKEHFIKFVESESFQKKLNDKIAYGINSHEARDLYKEEATSSVGTMEDFLLARGLVSNILVGLSVVGDDVFGDLLVLDNEPGRLVQMLIGAGSKLEISISIQVKPGVGDYIITRFNGVDFTVAPAFDTELLSKEVA